MIDHSLEGRRIGLLESRMAGQLGDIIRKRGAAGRDDGRGIALQDHGGAGKPLADRQAVPEIERGLDVGEPASRRTEGSPPRPDPRRVQGIP